MAEKIVKTEVASRLGVSAQYLYRVLREKTCDPKLAATLAQELGGTTSDYLRAPRPRGRARTANDYPFGAFLREFKNDWAQEDDVEVRSLILLLAKRYEEYRGTYFAPPENVQSLGHLVTCLEAMELGAEYIALARRVWNRFRHWQLDNEIAARRFDIDMGDNIE